jgi:ubiquinone/menaquinone biosynthesis C-methylase UbiE
MGFDLETCVTPGVTVEDWDDRLRQQLDWSKSVISQCQKNFPLAPFSKLLEVGCGTGRVISSYPLIPGGFSIGVDIDFNRLEFSHKRLPSIGVSAADGYSLPFSARSFDQTICHYLLLWAKNPLEILIEMKRVTKKGGMIFIFSEPDYGGRIDFPNELLAVKDVQIMSLKTQGADPFIGRLLLSLLQKTGLKSIQTGMLQWSPGFGCDAQENLQEWKVFENDAEGILSQAEIEKLRSINIESVKKGDRVLFVPVFYGWGVV